MNSLLKCPVCGNRLELENRDFECKNGHLFDRAASGYVNLLISQKKNPGDNREMVVARRDFLASGYFKPLLESLTDYLSRFADSSKVLLDAGCGEGYYTDSVADLFGTIIGVDMSKEAVNRAAKRKSGVLYCAASVFDLPVFDGEIDIITSIFAPYSAPEFTRAVKPGGFVISVIPGKRHLFGLKEQLYEHPYENDECSYELPGFCEADKYRVEFTMSVNDSKQVQNLFKMTPYFWRTPQDAAQKLMNLPNLKTEASFVITAYKRD